MVDEVSTFLSAKIPENFTLVAAVVVASLVVFGWSSLA